MLDLNQHLAEVDDLIRRYKAYRRKNPLDLWNMEDPHREDRDRHFDEPEYNPLRGIPPNIRKYIQNLSSQKNILICQQINQTFYSAS